MPGKHHEELKDREWLRNEYEVKLRSAHDIGKDINCDKACVYRALKRHGIKTRQIIGEPGAKNTCTNCKVEFEVGGRGKPKRSQVYCSASCAMLCRPKQEVYNTGSNVPRPRKGKDTLHNEEWLRTKYLDEGLTYQQIADIVGCTRQSVHWAIHKFKVKREEVLSL